MGERTFSRGHRAEDTALSECGGRGILPDQREWAGSEETIIRPRFHRSRTHEKAWCTQGDWDIELKEIGMGESKGLES